MITVGELRDLLAALPPETVVRYADACCENRDHRDSVLCSVHLDQSQDRPLSVWIEFEPEPKR